MEPEALVFSHDPALQLLIDVVSQREESRTAEAAVVIDPPPQERINLSGHFSQRPWRLPGNAQGPDRRPHGFHRRRGNRSHPPAVQAAAFAGIMGRVRLARAAAMREQAYAQGSTPRLRQVSMTLRPAA